MDESKEEFEDRKRAGLDRRETARGAVLYNNSLQKRMDEVLAHAATIGKLEHFESVLARVAYPTFFGRKARTLLTWDFAPYSFCFCVQTQDESGAWKFAMNGGLIFHAADQSWSVHT